MLNTEQFMHKPFFERDPLCDHPVHHHEHMHHEKPRYTMTEEMEHSARLMRETIDRLLRFEKRVKDEMVDLSKKLTSDNVIFKNTLYESWNSFLMEVKNEVNIFESTTSAEYQAFKAEIESSYANLSEDVRQQISNAMNSYEQKLSEFVKTINERIEQNNTIHEEAFADFQRSITTQLNTFEQTINAQMNNFMESVNNTLHTFKEAWEAIMETRLNNQDAKLDDMEMYMKTNLTTTVTTLIGDMHANGEFADIIEGEVFNDLQRKVDGFGRISILYFGAVGDGKTDNTSAFNLATATGKPIFIPEGVFVVNGAKLPKSVNGFGTIRGDVTIEEMNASVEDITFEGGVVTIDCRNSWFKNCHIKDATVHLKKWANCFANCNFWRTEIQVETVNGATNNFVGCYMGGAERLFYGTPANLHIVGGWIEENKYVFDLDNTGTFYGITVENCDMETNNNLVHVKGGVYACPITFKNCVILGNSVTTHVLSTEGTTDVTNNVSILFDGCYTENVHDFATLRAVNAGIEGLPQACYTKAVPYDGAVNVSWSVREPLQSVSIPAFDVVEVANGSYRVTLPRPCFIGAITCEGATAISADRCVNGEFVTTERNGEEATFNSTCYAFTIACASKPAVTITTPSTIYGGN